MNGIDHLLDTNVIIGLLKGAAPALLLVQDAGLVMSRTGVSQITRMELLGFPALGAQEEQMPREFLSRSAGLKLPDAIVAATALVSGARLLTLDQRLARVMAGPHPMS